MIVTRKWAEHNAKTSRHVWAGLTFPDDAASDEVGPPPLPGNADAIRCGIPSINSQRKSPDPDRIPDRGVFNPP
jgi:hypothetical protein